MAQAKELFVIASRYVKTVRLTKHVFSSQEAAKAALDDWEQNHDPDRASYERRDMGRRRPSYKEPNKFHNDRQFEVIDLESHINHVAAVNFEQGRSYPVRSQERNTTISRIDALVQQGKLPKVYSFWPDA